MPTPQSSDGASRRANINIRVLPRQRDLIDHAASVLGKTRSEFMLDTACREAENVLLDQRLFYLDAEDFSGFQAMLDRSPDDNPKLQQLLTTKAPWDT